MIKFISLILVLSAVACGKNNKQAPEEIITYACAYKETQVSRGGGWGIGTPAKKVDVYECANTKTGSICKAYKNVNTGKVGSDDCAKFDTSVVEGIN